MRVAKVASPTSIPTLPASEWQWSWLPLTRDSDNPFARGSAADGRGLRDTFEGTMGDELDVASLGQDESLTAGARV